MRGRCGMGHDRAAVAEVAGVRRELQ
jgi:hypothetical protein